MSAFRKASGDAQDEVIMSWQLIRSIQTDLRLILPFGLNLKLGVVIGVGKDGNFTPEGSADSILAGAC